MIDIVPKIRVGTIDKRIAKRASQRNAREQRTLEIIAERGWDLRLMWPDEQGRTLELAGQGPPRRYNRVSQIVASRLPYRLA